MIQDKIFFDEKDPTGLSYNTPFTFYGSYQGRLYSKTPTGSIKYYTQNSDLSVYATTGSNQFSGSQTVTGSLTVTGTITGTVAGTTATASYVEYTNVANKPALVSGSSQVTYSGLTGIPSGIVSGSAQIVGYGVFATTGSNGFNGSQSITGSLTVTGQVIAQTLNVQQVTSSVVYSSGSNIFGNSLANTQQFTGSVSVTGSLAVAGASTFANNITATGNLNLQGAVTRNINFYDSSNTNINAQIQYDQISSTSGQLFFGTNNAGTFATRLTISNTGAATFSSTVSATQYTAPSTGGSGLRVYGAAGTNQWDIYLNSTNLRFSDNTGTGSIVFDRPLSGTSAAFIKSDNSTTAIGSFAANNLSQQTEIWYGGVRMGGTSANVDLNLEPKGTGILAVASAANFSNRLNVTKADATSIIVANYDVNNRMEMSANGLNLVGGNPFYIKQAGGSDQFTITTTGNVGIGTTSITDSRLQIKGANNTTNAYADGLKITSNNETVYAQYSWAGINANDVMRFATAGTERMRITSGGFLKASNDGTYVNGASSTYHEFKTTLAAINMYMINTNAEGNALLVNLDSNSTSYYFFRGYYNTGDSNRIFIYSNGNIVNVNNSYGALSDIKLKENIEDATPKLDDLMKVKVRNYNLIGDDKKQIGVIAQELEEIFPAMIDESPDRNKDEIDLGTTTKSVKYSVFVPILIKAIQELSSKVETLEAKIQTLEQQ